MTRQFVKFLIFLALINSLFFSLAGLYGFSVLLVVLVELFLFLYPFHGSLG